MAIVNERLVIRDFYIGSISSIDFLTFFVLLNAFHANSSSLMIQTPG